jgi:hypothetical protein
VENIQSLGPKLRSVRTRNVFSAGEDCIGNRHQVDDTRRDVLGKQIEKPLNILSVEVLCKDSAANGVRELEFAQLGRKDRKRRSLHYGRRGSSMGVRNVQGEKKTRVSVSRQ